MVLRSILVLVASVAPFVAGPAIAADAISPTTEAAATSSAAGAGASEQDESGWEFAVTPYLWMAGTSGEVQLAEGESVEVDTSFIEVLGDLKFAMMLGMEARRDHFVLLGDIIYLSLGMEGEGPNGFVDATVDPKMFIGTFLGGYRVVDEGPMFVDILVGARVSSLDIAVELEGPLNTFERERSKTSIAPVLGARLRAPLGEDWGVAVYGDVGGFGLSADLSWQLMGTVQYDVSRNWRLAAGYRYVSIQKDKNDFDVDLALSGPIMTFSYLF